MWYIDCIFMSQYSPSLISPVAAMAGTKGGAVVSIAIGYLCFVLFSDEQFTSLGLYVRCS